MSDFDKYIRQGEPGSKEKAQVCISEPTKEPTQEIQRAKMALWATL